MDVEEIVARVAAEGLEMRPPLAEETVAEWEAEHGVSLPADYRRFLLLVGDGGAGPPFYDLRPLGHPPEDYHFAGDPSLPWPLLDGWMEDWEEPWPEGLESEEDLEHGHLVLGTDGCGMYWHLIVSGECAGEVWRSSEVGFQRYPGSSFGTWYGAWLEAGCPETMPFE